MGIETIALAALAVAQADSNIRAAEKKAEAVVREGELATQEKARQVARKASKAQVSFLNSGITLDPEETSGLAVQGIFDVGLQDINLIRENANTQSKNIMSAARTQAILDLGKAAIGAAGGSSFGESTFLTRGTGDFAGFGQALGAGFDPNAVGPFEDPFAF